jgi:hypothetical protein
MDTTQHDHDESVDTGSSRPDDPAVAAAAAGKTTAERSDEGQSQHQPSQRHNRGPPDDDQSVERIADDVLLGARRIAEHITALGFPIDESGIYYASRAKTWPLRKYGGFLMASKSALTAHAERLLRGAAV